MTDGRVIVRGQMQSRAQPKRADDALFHKPGQSIGVIEAKDSKHSQYSQHSQKILLAESSKGCTPWVLG